MLLPLHERLSQIQPKLHGAAVGMTLGIGTYFASQGASGCPGGSCPASAACPSGTVCWARLPLLAIPLIADGAILVAGKVLAGRSAAE